MIGSLAQIIMQQNVFDNIMLIVERNIHRRVTENAELYYIFPFLLRGQKRKRISARLKFFN